MAAELRLILLGVGIVLIAGLFWWEKRRSGAAREADTVRSSDRFEPRLDSGESGASGAAPVLGESLPEARIRDSELDTQEMPAMRAAHHERPVPHGDPPVVTIDNLPEDPTDVFLAAPELGDTQVHAQGPRQDGEAARTKAPAPDPANRRRRVPDPPVVTPEPGELTEREVDGVLDEPPPLADPPPRHQRIVAIRLLARDGQRIDGKELKTALGGEGLAFGRYSIYHRVPAGGRPLYSVASLVEPGSFDPEQMAATRFPGISLFAVFPGPLPAPQCFDEMLATARRLADRLGGMLQDDTGSSLTGQRVLSIREDLVHFEHLVALSRTRPQA